MWSSIVRPATALLHHTSSTNLCILLSPSIAFPKLMNGAPVHSGRLVVSESANLCLSPPFLSQWRRLPFLRTIFEAVLTIWSQSSEYEFKVILAPQWRSSSFFPGANGSEEIESSAPQGGGASSPELWVSGEATSKGNRVSDWGTVDVHRSTLAARQPPSSLHTEEDLSEPCPRYPLVDIEQ